MQRRNFLKNTSMAAAGLAFAQTPFAAMTPGFAKKRIAMIGTGHRGTGFWGESVVKNFGDLCEFVRQECGQGEFCKATSEFAVSNLYRFRDDDENGEAGRGDCNDDGFNAR